MVPEAKGPHQPHDEYHRGHQDQGSLVLEAVQGIVHQPIDGLGPEDDADGAAVDQQHGDHIGGILQPGEDADHRRPGGDRRLMPDQCELAAVQRAVRVDGKAAGRDHIGHQAHKDQQAQHQDHQMGEFEGTFFGLCCRLHADLLLYAVGMSSRMLRRKNSTPRPRAASSRSNFGL